MSDVIPMVDGGAWLAEGSGQAQYVANPDHVARLLASGYQLVADPRLDVPDGRKKRQNANANQVEEPAEAVPEPSEQGQEKKS